MRRNMDNGKNNGSLLSNSSAPASSALSSIVTCKNNPIHVDHPYQNVTVAIGKTLTETNRIHFVNLNSSILAKYPDLAGALIAEDKHYDEVTKYYDCKGSYGCHEGPGPSFALFTTFCAGVAEPLVKDPLFRFNDYNGQNGEATGVWTTGVRVSDKMYVILLYLGHG